MYISILPLLLTIACVCILFGMQYVQKLTPSRAEIFKNVLIGTAALCVIWLILTIKQ